MAQRATVYHLDDLELQVSGERVPAIHRGVRFGLDGKLYEIDLSDDNYRKLADVLHPFKQAARRSGTSGRRSTTAPSRPQRDNDAIRRWAREQGMTVADVGRVPANIVEKYDQRNQNGHRPAAAHHAVGLNPVWTPPVPPQKPPTPPRGEQPPASVTHEPKREGLVFADKKALNRAVRAWFTERGEPISPRGVISADKLRIYAHHNGEPRLAE